MKFISASMLALFPLLASCGAALGVALTVGAMCLYLDALAIATGIFVVAVVIATAAWLQAGLHLGHNAEDVLMDLNTSAALNAVVAITLALTYASRIVLLRRLHPRARDQSAILLCGGALGVLTLGCWCTSKFLRNSSLLFVDKSLDSSLVVLPTMVYFLRISLATMSACLVFIFLYSHRGTVALVFYTENPSSTPVRSILFLVLALTLSALPVVIFILDLTNTYANLLSEMFNLTADWSATVICYFLHKDLATWAKIKQSQGVLGRRVFNQSGALDRVNLRRLNRFGRSLVEDARGSRFNARLGRSSHKIGKAISRNPPAAEHVFVHKVSRL